MDQILSKMFNTGGRLSRWVYFLYQISIALFYLLLSYLVNLIDKMPKGDGIWINILPIVLLLIIIWCYIWWFILSIIGAIKRIHDLDCWINFWRVLLLIFFFPYAIYIFFAKWTVGPNKYWPDPLEIKQLI